MLKRCLENIKERNGQKHDENQYLNLIDDIIKYGTMVNGRNGNALTIFGTAMHFSLENNKIPILTSKKLAIKTCIKELLWFISGNTDNKILKQQNVHIWDDNGSREFLNSRGLTNLEEDDLGPVYGHQWRHFNASYGSCNDNYEGKGVDQLEYIINCLKNPKERYSRRLIMSAWNPVQLDEMALPPCHVLAQFNVINDELSCSLYQRSGDVGLGVPFNIASYSVLTHILAKHCNLKAKEFVYYLGNSHIYDDHINELKEQINREPFEFPTVDIVKKDNINDYKLEDIDIIDYKYHPSIKMKMRK
jgi:thymidylate synthase